MWTIVCHKTWRISVPVQSSARVTSIRSSLCFLQVHSEYLLFFHWHQQNHTHNTLMNTQPSGYNFPYKRSPLHQTGSVEWWDTFVAVKYNLHMTLDQYQFSKPVPSILWTHTTCMPLVVDCHVLLDREPSMAGRQAGRGKTNPCMWDFILFGYNTVQALCPYIHVSFSSCRPLYPESCWCFVVQALHFTMVIIVHRTFPLVQLHLLMALPCYARGVLAYCMRSCNLCTICLSIL